MTATPQRSIQQIYAESIVEQKSCTSQRTCATQNTTPSSCSTNWKNSHNRNAKTEWVHERENEWRCWSTRLLPARPTFHQKRGIFFCFGTGENLDKISIRHIEENDTVMTPILEVLEIDYCPYKKTWVVKISIFKLDPRTWKEESKWLFEIKLYYFIE